MRRQPHEDSAFLILVASMLTVIGVVAFHSWRRIAVGSIGAIEVDEPIGVATRTSTARTAGRNAINGTPGGRETGSGSVPSDRAYGHLVVLEFFNRRPVPGLLCRLRPARSRRASDTAPAFDAWTDSAGRFEVPEGRWVVSDPENAFVTLAPEIEVREGRDSVLFVVEVGSRSFLVSDLDGMPLAGVAGTLTALRADEADFAWIRTSDSDRSGLLTFEGTPLGAAVATFSAEGFHRRTVVLGAPSTEVVRVPMRPLAGQARWLSVTMTPDGSPVLAARLVCRTTGRVICSTGPSTHLLRVPAWVKDSDPLEVHGPGVFPCQVRLRDVVDGTIHVWPAHTLRLTVQQLERTDEDLARVWVVLDSEAGSAPSAVLPLVQGERWVPLGVPQDLRVPGGVPLVIGASDDRGRNSFLRVTVTDVVQHSEVALNRAEGVLEAVVVDEAGNPLPAATAQVQAAGGQALSLRADASGRIHVPVQAHSLFIQARGFLGMRVWRSLLHEYESRELIRLRMEMQRGAATRIRVTDQAGRPQSGLVVTVSSATERYEATAGEHGWRSRVTAGSSGITNGEGVACLEGIAPGDNLLVIGLPLEYSSEPSFLRVPYRGAVERVFVRDGQGIDVVCEPPRPVIMEVFEKTSGLPVEGFALMEPESGLEVSVEGHRWEGWVSGGAEVLSVVVPDVGNAQVMLSNEPGVPQRVEVPPGIAATIDVSGLPSGVEPGSLVVQVFMSTGAAMINTARLSLAWRAGMSIPLCLPLDGEMYISLDDLVLDGRKWTFEPSLVAWQPGGSLMFVARPE